MATTRVYFVYIMASRSRVLYVGVTGVLERRVFEHRLELRPGFTSRFRVTRLVYFEMTSDVRSAIAREKEIKGWSRSRKLELISSTNPEWKDLTTPWIGVENV